MSAVALRLQERRDRLGLKGPRAAQWLGSKGLELPGAPNSWTHARGDDAAENAADNAVLVARLGASEFFLEDRVDGATVRRLAECARGHPTGVYPVLREDWAFHLGGEGVHEVLMQVCNVNFASLALDSQPVIMTLMIGVAVLVVPRAAAGAREYRIWCDPTFGPYLGESLGEVVSECGGRYTGVSR